MYNQQTQIPTESITVGNNTLVKDQDYTVEYRQTSDTGEVITNPTNVGTNYVVLTGKGNYSGTKSISYTITQCSIANATVTLDAQSYVWQGKDVEAGVTQVVTTSGLIVPNTDYTVEYSNNNGAKTATVTITGQNNFTGTVTKDYVISCGTLNSFLYLNIGDNVSVNGTMYVTYNDEVFSPIVVVRDSLGNQLTEQDYTITYTRNGESTTDFESAGTITITATPKQNTTTGSTNYTGSSVGTFIINALDITDTAVIVVSGTYTYNGQGQEATIEVYAASGGKQLTVNTDYNTPTYQDNINAGDAQVSVTFKGNYTGSTTQTFVINKRDISDADINITGVNTEYTYNRFAQKPVPTVTDTEVLTQGTNTVLKETTDYTLTYTQDSTNVGSKTITITGQGNYGGTRDVNYTILAKDIADFTVTPSTIQDTVYTGSAIKPSITSVVWEQFDGTNNYTLSLSEYIVNYGANTNVGDAQVTIQGRVNYTGSITLNFEITPKSVENLTITVLDTNIIYTGQAISPSIEVRDGATVLVVGKDYSVDYGNNINASNEATITIQGMGNYNSATQKTVNFTISPRSIADGIITGVSESYTYTGKDIKPAFRLTVNGIELTENDYEANYSEDCINVGQKTITIQGKGNYTGELPKQYSITVADLEDCLISLPQYEYVYNGKSQAPTPTLTYNNLTVSDTNYTFNYSSDTINKGTVTITITATENGNFTGYTTVSYEVTPKDIATIQVTGVEEKDYTGSAIIQNITLTDNDILIDTVAKILELNKDYKLEYSNNTNVTVQDGQVVEGASIEITGNGNYTGTKTVNFKINPIEITSLDLDAYSITYDRTSHKPALTVKAGNMQVNSSYYTATYTRNNEVIEDFTSAGTIVITITTNSNNFIDGVAPLTKELVITPATIDKVTLSVSSVVYNTQENKPVISSVGTVNGLELQDSEYTIAYTRNETTTLDFTNCGIITVTVSSLSSNFTGSASAEYEITKKDISDLTIKYYFALEDGSLTDELGEPSDIKVYMEKDQTYKGQRVEAEITYIVSETHSQLLTKTQDYLYSFERVADGTGDIETVGEVTITIQGQGNYKGTITEVYKVTPADFTDENITITITNQNIIYTGSAITLTASDVEIRDKRYSEDNVLVWGEDFELYSGDVEMSDGETITVDKYLNNINVGRATVFFVGKGDYNQNQVMWANFEIKAKDINSSELSFAIEEIERVYTGSAYTPTLTTATFNGTPLVQGEDYTLSYNPNTNAGDAKVIIQGINNFAGTKEITFTISKKNIEDQEVVLTEISDKNYSIDLVKPDVIMTYNQLSLKETSDFTVTFKRQNASGSWENTSDFCSIGIIQYEITGVGNYTGLLTKTYEIFAKGIAEVILSLNTIVYDRTQHIPTITVKDNIGDIIAENEYVISYQIADESGAYGESTSTPPDFINVCKVKITATASNNSNYSGSSFAEFEITKKDINALTFDNSVIPLLTYNNTNITFTDSDISGILKYGSDYNLILNTDYAITYTQDQRVNAGEYNITLYGINNYSGTIQTTFTISPKQISDLTYNANAIKDKTYNGSNQTLSNSDLSGVLSWTVNELPYNLVLDTDYTITYTEDDRTNYGEYNITITGKGNYAGTIPSTFTVLQKNIEDITITYSQVSDTTYTGQAINPQITVTDTERRVALTTDIEITYGTENTDVSWENSEVVAKASVTIKGVGNYTGTKVIYFKVLPKQLTDSDITVESVGPQPYTGEKITPTPKVTWNARELTETEIVYSYGENTKVGYGSITITAIENGNFDGSLDIQFTIGATDIQLAEISDIEQNLTYNRLEQKQTPTVTYNNNNLIKDTDYTLEYSSDLINKGTVTITIKGINNFIGTKTVTYNINAKQLTDTDITINGIQDEVTYTGNDITFNLSLSINEWEDFDLTESHYSTSYSNNKDVSWLDGVVQANASVTINFVGNFTGSITKYYTIQPKALENSMLTQILNQTYTGQEIKPNITITYNNIQYGNDFFTVDYNTNIDVGQASVDISAKPNSNFTGSLSTNFNITAKVITDLSLFDVTITTPEDGFIYKASAYTPDITISVKSSSDTLNKDTDYTVSYGDNTSAGNGEIYITFIKNYNGTVTQTFTIQKRMLTDSAVTYTNLTSVTYDGEEHKQSPVLTLLDSYTLNSSDYICEFKRNNEITTDFVSTGTITVVLTGQGNFDGTLTLSYDISSKDFNSSEVTVNILDTNIVYTGSKITPEIEVKYGELTLEKDVNYSVEYGENLNALTKGTITITAIDGNYTGSKTVEFDIQQKEITLSMISSIQEQSYTGGKIEPEVTITYNEMTLEKDTDFNANYTDNINVGPANIEITGIGNYTGTVNISFEITPLTFIEEDETLNIDITWTDGTPDLTYTGSEHTPTFSLQYTKENLETSLQETDYTYEYKDNTKAGLAILQVTGKGNYTGTVEFNFTIKTKDLDLSMFQSLDDVTYTGQEIKPDIIGEFNSTPLVVNVDYSVLYENNQNAGLATVKITGKGNFTNNEVILTFNINKRSITELTLSDENVIYNGSEFNITLTVTADNLTLNSTDYELTYEDISGGIIDIPNLTDAGKTVFVVTGINNFTGTLKQTLTIQTKNFIDEDIVVTGVINKDYNLGLPITQTISVQYGDLSLNEFEHYDVAYENNQNAGLASIILTGKGNYSGSKTINFTISQISPTVNPYLPDRTYFEGDNVPQLLLHTNDTKGTITITETVILLGTNDYNWTFIPTDTTNYLTTSGTISITGIALEVVSIEFDGAYKSEYNAYEPFNPTGIIVFANYNNGDRIEIAEGYYTLSLTAGEPVTMQNAKIQVFAETFYEGSMEVELTVNPLPLTVTFDNYSNLVETEAKQYISISIDGELPDYSADITYSYLNLKTGTESDGITLNGDYTVTVKVGNNNYYIEGEDSISFNVKVGIIYDNPETRNVIVISTTGFDNDVTVTIDTYITENEIQEILGNVNTEAEVVYVVRLWKNGEAYIPTNDYTIRIKVDSSLLSNQNLQVYTLEGTYLKNISYSTISNNYIELGTNTMGTIVLSTAVQDMTLVWLILGIVLLLLIIIVVTVFSIRYTTKQRIKRIRNMSKNKTTQENKE